MKSTVIPALAMALLSVSVSGSVYLINGFTIVDNDPGPNFLASGFGGTDVGANNDGGFNFTRLWGNAGAGTTAVWNFGTGETGDPALATGEYEVFVSWKSTAQSNLNAVDYDGSDGFVPIRVDQEPGSLSYTGTLGTETFYTTGIYAPGHVTFVRLGTVSITDGGFSLTMTDDAIDPDYAFADAAALRPVPEPSVLASFIALVGGSLAVVRRRR